MSKKNLDISNSLINPKFSLTNFGYGDSLMWKTALIVILLVVVSFLLMKKFGSGCGCGCNKPKGE